MALRFDSRALAAFFSVGLLAILVYANAWHNPFVYDDYHTVVANASLDRLADIRTVVLHDVARPMVNLSYAIDRAVWGTAPPGFHMTSVLLHALNALLLLILARRIAEDSAIRLSSESGASGLAAFASASLFAVHPMMSEAVGYISGRSEVLCTTFVILALLNGRRWLFGGGVKFPVLTGLFWIAGLATRETAAVFPFLLLGYDRLVLPGLAPDRRKRLLTVHLPLLGAALLAGAARLVVLALEYRDGGLIHGRLIPVALEVVGRYAWLMVVPARQTIFHAIAPGGPLSTPVLAAAALVVAMLWLIWILRGIEPGASFGLLWFLIVLVPSSLLVLLNRGEPMAEHRVYLASCGVFLAAGRAVSWLDSRLTLTNARARLVTVAGLIVLLLSYGADTVVRNAVWSDPIRLWQESVDLAPAHFRPRLLLGEALDDAGRREEAIEQFRMAIRLQPGEPTGYAKLGRSLAELGRLERSRGEFRATEDRRARARRARRTALAASR